MGKKRLAAFLDVVLFKICVGAKNHVFSRAFFYTFAMMACQKKTQKYMQEKSMWCIFCCFPIQIFMLMRNTGVWF